MRSKEARRKGEGDEEGGLRVFVVSFTSWD